MRNLPIAKARANAQKGGYANNTKSVYGLAKKAEAEDVRILTGVKVTGFKKDAKGAVTAVETDRGTIGCDQVIVGAVGLPSLRQGVNTARCGKATC